MINRLAKVAPKLCSSAMSAHYLAFICIQSFDPLRGINVALSVMLAKYEHGNDIGYLHE